MSLDSALITKSGTSEEVLHILFLGDLEATSEVEETSIPRK
jgi:hypothetical protein